MDLLRLRTIEAGEFDYYPDDADSGGAATVTVAASLSRPRSPTPWRPGRSIVCAASGSLDRPRRRDHGDRAGECRYADVDQHRLLTIKAEGLDYYLADADNRPRCRDAAVTATVAANAGMPMLTNSGISRSKPRKWTTFG